MSPTATAPAKSHAASYDIAKSDETLDLAKDLAKFIKENKLSTQVQGKEFVNVEGWQYAGSRLGIVPIVEHVINCSTEQELKYQAKVTLFDMRSQHTVGAGFAICSNKESGRKFYQEFAIASMAQTRAIGKAYRNILAWIIRAAGYEPTPAEEMEYSGNVPTPAAAPVAAEPAPLMRAVANTPAPAEAAEVVYARAEQKAEIIRLLNHPLITRQEKTKMLLNINRFDEERATQATAKLTRAIEGRGGNPAEATLGNEPAGETPAAQPSDAPAASTTSAPSIDAERLAELRAKFESLTSSLDIKDLWDKLTGGEQKELRADKEAALTRVAEAVALAARTMTRQQPAQMKEAGTDASLVAEFVEQPTTEGVEFVAATKDQKNALTRLLDHPKITRKEKTTLLLKLNKLDKERARQALLKLRQAIADREGVDPMDGARAAVKAFVLRHEGQLSISQADELRALADSQEATLEFLLDAVDLAQASLTDEPVAIAA